MQAAIDIYSAITTFVRIAVEVHTYVRSPTEAAAAAAAAVLVLT